MKFKGRIVWEKGYPYILTVVLLVGISIFSCIDFLAGLRTENGVLIINAINLKLFSTHFILHTPSTKKLFKITFAQISHHLLLIHLKYVIVYLLISIQLIAGMLLKKILFFYIQ